MTTDVTSSRPKDSMRSRVAEALPEIHKHGTQFGDIQQARLWFAKFINYKKWQKYREAVPGIDNHLPVEFHISNQSHECWTCGQYSRVNPLHVTRGNLNTMWFLHILAHIAQPNDSAWHGPQFVQIWLDLIQRAHGLDARRAVKDILIAHRIKTKTVSKETRLRQSDQYMARQAPVAKDRLKGILADLMRDNG